MSCTLRLLPCLLPMLFVLYVASLALSLTFALYFICYVFCLVSCFCLISYTLYLLPCFLFIEISFLFECSRSAQFFLSLSCILCITFLALFFCLCLISCALRFLLCFLPYILCIASLTMFLAYWISVLFECNKSAWFSLYIISFDKQLSVELAANQYRYLVWHYWVFCVLRLCLVSGALRLLLLLFVLCVLYLVLSFASSLALYLAFYFALFFVKFSFLFRYNIFAHFFTLHCKSW